MRQTDIDRLKEVAAEVFGDRSTRDKSKAIFDKKTEKYVGGIAFERNEYAEAVKGSGRAYTIGPTVQPHANLVAPTKHGKNRTGDQGKLDEGLTMRKHISEVNRNLY
jgi:hypothetical protein